MTQMRSGLVWLTLLASCGRASAEAEHPRPSCGGVIDGPPVPFSCPAPTTTTKHGCDLISSALSGSCVPGFALQPQGGPADVLCVPVAPPRVEMQPDASKDERAVARAVLSDAHSICDEARGATVDLNSVRENLRERIDVFPHPALWGQLAKCEELSGHVSAALLAWRTVLRVNPPQEPSRGLLALLKTASERAAALEQRLAHLTLQLPQDHESVRVSIDRALYSPELLASGIDLDAGRHEVVVTAHNRRPWLMHVTIAEGAKTTFAPSLEQSVEGVGGNRPREQWVEAR
ncbi:MAG: hypothetical protein ACOY0T_33630 [Myxococcota bacterium]